MHPKHRTNKVGLVAYGTRSDGQQVFLIHLPKAKNPAEQDQIKWGLVRGTVRSIDGEDLRSLDALRALAPAQIEPPEQALLAEAAEEAGIQEADIINDSLKSAGYHTYHSSKKPPYEIAFFTMQIDPNKLQNFKDKAQDAADLALVTQQELQTLCQQGQCNRSYLNILRAIQPQSTAPAG